MISWFGMSELAVMGLADVLGSLPRIVRRVWQAVDAVVRLDPDVLVIIDSPDFTHQVAKRVRRRAPDLPVINYVSPSVWAWRPGRAKKMRAYVDHVLALKPFEPEAHRRLGGPACTYVGHPLIEQVDQLRPGPGERPPLVPGSPVDLLVLPGSRRSEIARLMERHKIRRVPVLREGRLVGLVSRADLLRAILRPQQQAPAALKDDAEILRAVHAAVPDGVSACAAPIMLSRVTRAARRSSLQSSVPRGRIGTTR